MEKNWKNRRNEVIKGILILLGIGMLYALFSTITGLRIPCVVYALTGLYCPGCGVTRMCLSLLRFDFRTAFSCNQLLFLSLPCLGGMVLYVLYRYIRYGDCKTGKAGTALLITLIVLFLAFGILRNLPGMETLQPPKI
ncbi:MAG: DUF2752 domain-containing protein [Lachnospiraceae bacterium]|nr:DUF2752 domain-containing protein [Lachnospiraceae bacterium]